jgi:hypothetical protein
LSRSIRASTSLRTRSSSSAFFVTVGSGSPAGPAVLSGEAEPVGKGEGLSNPIALGLDDGVAVGLGPGDGVTGWGVAVGVGLDASGVGLGVIKASEGLGVAVDSSVTLGDKLGEAVAVGEK